MGAHRRAVAPARYVTPVPPVFAGAVPLGAAGASDVTLFSDHGASVPSSRGHLPHRRYDHGILKPSARHRSSATGQGLFIRHTIAALAVRRKRASPSLKGHRTGYRNHHVHRRPSRQGFFPEKSVRRDVKDTAADAAKIRFDFHQSRARSRSGLS